MKGLNARSDAKAWLQTGGYLGVLVVTGSLSFYVWSFQHWWLLAVCLFLHGTVAAFIVNAVHELVHGTVFKTSWLNRFFAHVFSFIGWINHRFFWLSHTEHHKFTLHPPDDLEVLVPIHYSIGGWLKEAFINLNGFKAVWGKLRHSLGILQGEWEHALLPKDTKKKRRDVFNWARFILLGHLLIAVVSLTLGYWIIPVIVSLTPFYGAWLFTLCNHTQHVGLSENVNDFRLNSRTIYLNPLVQFLYWHMNYHIEHHMYAGIPCYHLGKLHRTIKHELPHIPRGLTEAWFEIAHILAKQKKDPNYRFLPELPEKEDGTLSTQSRLQQLREESHRLAR